MKQTLKKIYQKLPFKQPIFKLVRIFIRPKENVYRHLYFHGDFLVQVDDSHSFLMTHYGFELENSLFWVGIRDGWEKNSVSVWIKLAKNADVIVDIGANTGIYSLIAKSLNPQARIFAFEPVPRVYERLVHNNLLNGYDIECFECGISNTDGTAIIYDTPTEHIYSVTVNKNLNAPSAEVIPTEIEVKRLDTIIDELGIEKIDLLKIDVETHEPEVLEGLGEYLSKYQPTILIEILNDEIGGKVETLVNEQDYLYFNIDEKSDSIRRVESITKSDYYNYLLCSEIKARELNLIS
ncbi:MAG TPA: FkbM family methyltransferase [Pyrinomonadaceae bacterium]|nr:FkbM family methyltransferase [Pyrinomonadaceae bacterium]